LKRGVINSLALIMVFAVMMATFSVVTAEFNRYALAVRMANELTSLKAHEKISVHLNPEKEGFFDIMNEGQAQSVVVSVLVLNWDGSVKYVHLEKPCVVSHLGNRTFGLLFAGNRTVGFLTSLGNVFWLKVANVTFNVEGVSEVSSSTVLLVDGKEYAFSSLPLNFIWEAGSTHVFEWCSVLPGVSNSTRFVWSSTKGGVPLRTGMVTVLHDGGHVTAKYVRQYTLTIEVNDCWMGETVPWPDVYWHDEESAVKVKANPYAGYVLDHWELDGVNVGSANPYTVTMESPHNLKAVFTEDEV